MWIRSERDGQVLWQVQDWQGFSWLRHGFSTSGAGDLLDRRNRHTIAEVFNLPLPWVTAQQVHGDHLEVVTTSDQQFEATDGLLTKESGIVLATFYADCVPLLFIDPIKKVVAVAHAGWRGTQKQIGIKMIQALCQEFGCAIHNIQAAIGPSIGPCCYTVGQDVAGFFPDSILETESGALRLDLWKENATQLLSVGVLVQNIHRANVCTACSDEFFSYRQALTKERMGALIGLAD